VKADILRIDGTRWADVVTSHVADFLDPNTSPDVIKLNLDELLRLAEAADAIITKKRKQSG